MDLSKLPRLSGDAHKPPVPQTDDPGPRSTPARRTLPVDVSPGQIWISLIVGAVFIMLGWNFARWGSTRLSNKPFETGVKWTAGPKAGQPVDYFELQGGTAWTEAGMFIFGLASLVDALALIAAAKKPSMSRTIALAALSITGIATLLNLFVAGKMFSISIMPIWSILAVAIGGFLLFDHWRLIQETMPRETTGSAMR